MKFCIISPTEGLQRYARLSQTHLVLPQITNHNYITFYGFRKREGDFIILDNGAYEGKQDMARVLHLIPVYRPNIVALPDFLLEDWQKTYDAARRFLDEYYYQYPDVKWMYTPQSQKGNIMGWIEGAVRILNDPRVEAVSLPRNLPLKITQDPLARALACKWLKQVKPSLYVHAFGMAAGNINEMPQLREVGCDSIDSSAPVWRGWNGIYLRDSEGRTVVPDVDFDAARPSEVADQIILTNLEACSVDTTKARAADFSQW